MACTVHKSCEVSIDPQNPVAGNYSWRNIMDHLRTEGVETWLSEKLGRLKAAMHTQEFRRTHSCPARFHLGPVPRLRASIPKCWRTDPGCEDWERSCYSRNPCPNTSWTQAKGTESQWSHATSNSLYNNCLEKSQNKWTSTVFKMTKKKERKEKEYQILGKGRIWFPELPYGQFSNFQQKNTRLTKKQENMAYSKEQNKFTEIIHKEVTVSVLLDKDFKTTALTMLKKQK